MSDSNGREPSYSSLAETAATGTFESALQGLEVVVEHLERGLLPIDEAIAWYELGLRLAQRSEVLLRNAELRVSELHDAFGISSDSDSIWQDTSYE
jgi:exodeoxyribonuclease VII small subunit